VSSPTAPPPSSASSPTSLTSSSSSSTGGAPPAPFTVAYLVNQYPHVSHSFIRREIAALEKQGLVVLRFSVRRPPALLVDPADLSERERTRVLLAAGPVALAWATVAGALAGPRRFGQALRAAIRLGRRSDRGVLRHLAYLAEACLLVRWLRAAGEVRHLHAHFGTNSAAVAMLARLLGGPPYSFTVHGPEEFDHPVELSLPEKIRHAAAVVAVSSFGRSQLFRWIPYTEWPKVEVVRCGVDAAFLAAGPRPVVDNRRLVCVGRLCEQKGQLLILEALGALGAEGIACELVLAGDGPMRAALEARIHALGLERAVRITGWISNETVRAEILGARVFLLPSFAEGLPVALMEALALGRPAISTSVAGIPELLEDGRNGWLIPAGSVEALVGAIRKALAAPLELLGDFGRHGADAVASRHDAEREAGRLAQLFRSASATTTTTSSPSSSSPSADG
jgi:glycosyltransferase involved in cell wall biosynthesis